MRVCISSPSFYFFFSFFCTKKRTSRWMRSVRVFFFFSPFYDSNFNLDFFTLSLIFVKTWGPVVVGPRSATGHPIWCMLYGLGGVWAWLPSCHATPWFVIVLIFFSMRWWMDTIRWEWGWVAHHLNERAKVAWVWGGGVRLVGDGGGIQFCV